jgi:hypothetical protein
MKRSELEHILRAAKGATGETEFIVISSQAILGRFPDAPRELRQSMEADLYPKFKPDLSLAIEAASDAIHSSTSPSAIGRMAFRPIRPHSRPVGSNV